MSAVGLIFILGFLVYIGFGLLYAEKKKHKKKLQEISENPKEYLKQLKQEKKDCEDEIKDCNSTIYRLESILNGTNKEWKKVTKTEKYMPAFSLTKKNRKVSGWETKFDNKNKVIWTRRQIEWEIKCTKKRLEELYSKSKL